MSKISIILSSERLDKLYPALVLASSAVSMGWSSEVFFTFWALLALKKGYEPTQLSNDYSIYSEEFKKKVGIGFPSWREMVKIGREKGLKIYACSTTMDILGVKKEDLEDFVDGIVGAPTFLSKARDSDIVLFI
ncbi:MAG: DsrE/DsrF/DrsH-like family protein [Candidatus Methanomethylicia archaeon]